MDVFSTPGVSFRTLENQANTMKNKNGPSKVLQRKPFLDRPVNSHTPVVDKLAKGVQSLKQQINTPKKKEAPEDLDAHEFMFSHKNVEDYDFWPKPPQMGTDGIIKILTNYCSPTYITPPPSPVKSELTFEIEPIFLNLPEPEMVYKQEETSEDEVDIPCFDESIYY